MPRVKKPVAKKAVKAKTAPKVLAEKTPTTRTVVPDAKILAVLKKAVTKKNPQGLVTPTELGLKLGKTKPTASSWACARLRKLVATGAVLRDDKVGKYRLAQ